MNGSEWRSDTLSLVHFLGTKLTSEIVRHPRRLLHAAENMNHNQA